MKKTNPKPLTCKNMERVTTYLPPEIVKKIRLDAVMNRQPVYQRFKEILESGLAAKDSRARLGV